MTVMIECVRPAILLPAVRMVALETDDHALRRNLTLIGLPVMEGDTAEPGTILVRPLSSAPSSRDHEQPTLFTCEDDGFNERLACVRRGGAGLLIRPYPIDELRRVIANCQRPAGFSNRRVLVVEDDTAMAALITQTLLNAGYRVECAEAASELIDKLLDFHPDLLLLDLHLPDCTGAELALIARQLPGFATMPILYISGESNSTNQVAALKCGADGFITKPIRPRDLIGRIDAVVSRLSELDRLAHFDALTGVFNARAARLELQMAMRVAARSGADLSIVLIDVDHFKKVNDVHGHMVGDRVLQRLGQLLTQHFRGSDMVGRLGGEEFLVVMPGASLKDALGLVDSVRKLFPLACKGACEEAGLPAATFSAGVAQWDGAMSPEALTDLADQRLYRAKAEGRNRVVSSDPVSA
jgi:diguanylate cyclase (GGDEF)-like protein